MKNSTDMQEHKVKREVRNARIVVFGRGYMAHRIESYLGRRGYDARIHPADVTNTGELEQVFAAVKPNIVINAAGKTVIDQVEKLENRAEAFLVNVGGPANIAYFAREVGAYCIQLGSGCIFNGTGQDGQGFKEDDTPNPGCYYGWTKAWSDWQLRPFLERDRILILRLRMPLSKESNPRNLLNKLCQYGQVIDSQNSITVVEDFLPALANMMEKRATGIFHLTNPGTMSPFEIVRLLQHYGHISSAKRISKISKQQLDQITSAGQRARRVNTVLNTDKLHSLGVTMRPIRQAVEESIKQFIVGLP